MYQVTRCLNKMEMRKIFVLVICKVVCVIFTLPFCLLSGLPLSRMCMYFIFYYSSGASSWSVTLGLFTKKSSVTWKSLLCEDSIYADAICLIEDLGS